MSAVRLWRGLLAAVFFAAVQGALVHPFDHLQGARDSGITVSALGDRQPLAGLHDQLCDLCVAGAALGATATGGAPARLLSSSSSFAASSEERVFLAAFVPLFRSQAPPALL